MRRHIQLEVERLAGIEIVGSAASATDAIAQIRRLRPDVVILDLQLAEGTGADILRELRDNGGAPVTIVLTNHADPLSRDLSIRAGAHFFFDKSANFDEFLSLMKIMCG